MATCTVSGVIKDASETGIQGVTIRARIVTPYFTTTILVLPVEVSTTSDSFGAWSLALNQGAKAIVQIEYPPNGIDSNRRYSYTIIVPASGTANFSTLATEL